MGRYFIIFTFGCVSYRLNSAGKISISERFSDRAMWLAAALVPSGSGLFSQEVLKARNRTSAQFCSREITRISSCDTASDWQSQRFNLVRIITIIIIMH